MEIVLTGQILVAEARIPSVDMGYVARGQSVNIKVNSYDYGRFGAVDGTLQFISSTTFNGEKEKNITVFA